MPQSPTSPTSPTASGPSSVRAIVNWLETSGTSTGSNKSANATAKALTGRLSHKAKDTASPSSPPVLPVPKLSSPPPVVVTPPSSKSNAVQPPPKPVQPSVPATSTPSPLPSPSPPLCPQTKPPQDYSKTLLRYQAFISQAQPKSGAGEAAAVRSGLGNKKSYGDLGRGTRTADGPVKCGRYERDKNDVDAYWTSVRAQLAISDEEIYGS